jgi:hypothetical protein
MVRNPRRQKHLQMGEGRARRRDQQQKRKMQRIHHPRMGKEKVISTIKTSEFIIIRRSFHTSVDKMKIVKTTLNIAAWVIAIVFQIVMGFIVGYTFFAEGYGNIIFMWIGMTIGIFLMGMLVTVFRRTISPKRYFLRLGLTALCVSVPLIVFYRSKQFIYNADYETPPFFPFLAIIVGIIGFYVIGWLKTEFIYWRVLRITGYVVSISVLIAGIYALWNWLTPFRLPIQNLEPDQVLNMELVNIVGDGFNPEVIQGNYVYGISDKRLAVFDISDPKHMFPVGQSEIISGDLLRINLFENYAYITSGNFGSDIGNEIHVVEITDPTHPRYLASYDLSGKYIWNVESFKNYLYIIGCIECTQYSYDQRALYIMDLNNPRKPVEVSHYYSDTNISDMAIYNNYVYLALAEEGHDYEGLRILNIANPKEPKEINSLFPSGKGYQVTISNSKLYFDGESQAFANGLYILDISNPVIPKELSLQRHSVYDKPSILPNDIGYTTKTTPCICAVRDETPRTVVTFIDYSDPKQPKQRGTFEFEGFSVDIQDHLALAWDSVTQVYRFFDISNFDNPKEVGQYIPFSLHDLSGEMFMDGTKAVIPTDETSLYILDLSNPSLPTLSTIYNVGDYYSVIKLYKNYVYLNVTNEIQILDISAPIKPSIVWRQNAIGQSGEYFGVSMVGDYMYMIDKVGGLNIYNISNPASPVLISHQEDLKGFGYIDGFDVNGRYFYVFEENDVRIFDALDPKNIIEVMTIYQSFHQRIIRIGNLAFLDDSSYSGQRPATLSIVDLSDPEKLKLVSSYNWLQWSTISGNSESMTYIADWYGLHIVDFSDPKNPKEIGFYGMKDGAKGIAVGKDNFVYVLSENIYALYVLRYIPSKP